MRRFGLFMGHISLGPARRLFKNQPEDMAKFWLIIFISNLVAFTMRQLTKEQAYQRGYVEGRRDFRIITAERGKVG